MKTAQGIVTVGGVEYGWQTRTERRDSGCTMSTGGYTGRLMVQKTYRDACGPAWDALLAAAPVGQDGAEWGAKVQAVLDAVAAQ